MLTSLLFGAAVMAPAAPIPKDTDPAPAGPAPWVLYLKANDNGQVAVTVSKYQTITQPRQVTTTENGQPVTKIVNEQVERLIATYHVLNDMKLAFVTVGGSAVPADAVMKRAKDGIVVLVSADGKQVSKAWLRAFGPDTVIASAEGLVSAIAPRPNMQVPTAAPRLVLLGVGADGKVQVAFNPAAVGNRAGDAVFAGRARMVFINNGAGAQPFFLTSKRAWTFAQALSPMARFA